MERIFYSKVGNMYYLLILIFSGLMLYHLWFKQIFLGMVFMICTYRLISMLTQLRYVLTVENLLSVRPGKPIPNKVVRIEDIDCIRPAHGRLRGFYGMSLDQIEICYHEGEVQKRVFLSPQNREEMIRALKKRNQRINTEKCV